MTIRQAQLLRKFNPTLNPKKDSSVFIACFVYREQTGFKRGFWHYFKYHFTPNKKCRMVRIKCNIYEHCTPMMAIQRYGVEAVHVANKIDGSKMPISILHEMNSCLQNDSINWLELEQPWINKHMMQAMKSFYNFK